MAGHAAGGFKNGVSLSTMGVGLDYNEDLMTRLATNGGGRYHFIRNSLQVAGVLNDELYGLVGTVARNATLTIAPSNGVRARHRA